MTSEPPRVVFDCVIFAQALINPKGPAGACLTAAETGECLLHISPFVLQEIRELPSKIAQRFEVSPERVELLILQLGEYAVLVTNVPEVYLHPVDANDSAYVNLALATGSRLVVSRDQHLLALMDRSTPLGQTFAAQFPALRVLKPVEFLNELHPSPPPA